MDNIKETGVTTKMVRRISTAIATMAVCAALATGAKAASDNSSSQSDFFREGMSARAYGMGNAFVGVSDDVTSVYWNPAGLGTLKAPQVMTTKTSLDFFDSNIQGISIASPYGRGVWAFNYVDASTDIPLFGQNPDNPLRFDYPLGITSERYTGLAVGYGLKWRPNLYLGASVKNMKYNLFGHTANGSGADIGLLLTDKTGGKIGVNLQNIGGVRMGVMDEVPFNIQVGVSKKFADDALLIAAAYDSNYLGKSVVGVGAEYKVAEHFTARVGEWDSKLAYGLSIDVENFRLDYSLNSGSDENETSKLSVGYFFNPKQPKPAPVAAKPAPAPEKPVEVAKEPEEKPKPKPAPKKETPKKEPVKKEEKPKKEAVKKEEAPAPKPVETAKVQVPIVNENASQPSIKLPSVQDLLGETGNSGTPAPSAYTAPADINKPDYPRFPSQEGEFGLSNEYEGQVP